ncbi:MAG: hypothetical protein HRU35_04590 [Rickettsiaceae bacterium]|nr:hypothetical protein [Rickettsiaceae bacterium]
MNKFKKIRLLRLLEVVLIITLPLGSNYLVYGDYQDLEVPTQVNTRTNYLYETKINPDELMKTHTHSFDDMKGIIGQDKSGELALQKMSGFTGVDSNEAKSKSGELQALDKASGIESKARAEMSKENTLNELYVDWENPLHKQELREAKEIGKAQDNLLHNLLGKLRELGIDCFKKLGNVEKEPEFYLQVRQKQIKDTKYNQHFCEHRQKKYNCNYRRYVKCEKHNQSMKWYKWQRVQTRTFSGSEIWHHHRHWFKDVFWKRDKRRHTKYWCYLRIDGGTFNSIANHIAALMGKRAGHVRVISSPSDRGEGSDWGADERRHVSNIYRVNYQYRDGDPICLRWTEEWRDECLLEEEEFVSPGKRRSS